MKNIKYISIALLAFICLHCSLLGSQKSAIKWGKLTPETLEQAGRENKIIILNLRANWCHWCHVMEDSTYANTAVVTYLNKHFIAVEADQDANPELSARYKKYGWPATIFINSKGEDVVKRAGYISPDKFLGLLEAIVKDPTPERENPNLSQVTSSDSNTEKALQTLEARYKKSLDYKKGGYKQAQKYIDYDAFEYGLFFAKNKKVNQWLGVSTEGAMKLSDPAWGGIYQYSTHFGWDYAHFEKLLDKQARYINIFTLTYMNTSDKKALEVAKSIVKYADRFLWQNGLYSNAQDADLVAGEHSAEYFELNDKERQKLGIPRVDTNTYTFNNAEFAQALLRLAAAIQDKSYHKRAMVVVGNLLKRGNGEGLYYHGTDKRELLSLKDNLAMAELLIELVKQYNKPAYKKPLARLIDGLINNFKLENGSFKSFIGELGLKPQPIVSENIKIARVLNWYSHYTKNEKYKTIAQKTFDFLLSPNVSDSYFNEPAIMSLAIELGTEPYSVVYYKPENKSNYFTKSRAMLPFYSLVDEFSNKDIPDDKKDYAEGFVQDVVLICTSTFCSSPIYDDESIQQFFRERLGE